MHVMILNLYITKQNRRNCTHRRASRARIANADLVFYRLSTMPTPPLVIPSVAEGSCGGAVVGDGVLDVPRISGRDVVHAKIPHPSNAPLSRSTPSPIVQSMQPYFSSLGKAYKSAVPIGLYEGRGGVSPPEKLRFDVV